jgi:hypothetical protein
MTEKSNSKKPLKILKKPSIALPTGLILVSAATLLVMFLPIRTVRVGECNGTQSIRLSLVGGDWKKIEAAKKDAQERRAKKAEFLKQHPGFSMGCSAGPTYRLYIF